MTKYRQALLLPRYSVDYPGLSPDSWYPARLLADLVLSHRRTGDWRGAGPRLLASDHFLFRCGEAARDKLARTRDGDQSILLL